MLNPKSQLFGNNRFTFENFENNKNHFPNIVNYFVSMLDFVGIAGENACVFELIEKGMEINRYDEYKKFITSINSKKYKLYHKTILQLRENYSHKYKIEYTNLFRPFKKVIETIKYLHGNTMVVICTMKPKENVVFLNKRFEISALFDEIITIDRFEKKIEVLEIFSEKKSIKKKNVYFIDDHPNHFREMFKSKIHCYLADWGYHLKKNIFGIEINQKNIISIKDFNFLIRSL